MEAVLEPQVLAAFAVIVGALAPQQLTAGEGVAVGVPAQVSVKPAFVRGSIAVGSAQGTQGHSVDCARRIPDVREKSRLHCAKGSGQYLSRTSLPILEVRLVLQ